ncbi:MAG: glycosyltransferase [Caulobacterales bacterium]
MITVVLSTLNSAEPLSRLLAALTPAAVDGLVRDVVLLDRGSTDATFELAEDAGASALRGGSLGDALNIARGEWLLWLPADAGLDAGWRAALEAHLALADQEPARIVPATERLFARLRGRRVKAGWLAPKRLVATASAGPVEAYLQRLPHGRRIRRLRLLAAQ